MTHSIHFHTLNHHGITPYLETLARLRIRIFREWPYLYEGDMAYERDYVARYAASESGMMVAVMAGETLIGMATGLALADEADFVRKPFDAAGINVAPFYYFGEFLLEQQWRGQGIGKQLMQHCEHLAKTKGYHSATFCCVQRDANHPLKPEGYRPPDGLWNAMGYAPQSAITGEFSWPDIAATASTPKPMLYWVKHFAGN